LSTDALDRRLDWPAAEGVPVLTERLPAATAEALRLLRLEFPDACAVTGADAWLDRYAAAICADLAGEMLSATIAVDHFAALLPCPRHGLWLRRAAWEQYVEERAAAVLAVLPVVLLRCAVLRCIAENWIPRERILAGVRQRLEQRGMAIVELHGDFRPIRPGGAAWLREHGARDLEDADQRLAAGRCAAVVCRAGGAVVVVRDGPGAWEAGVTVLPAPTRPPAGVAAAIWNGIGLGPGWWRLVRHLRGGR
jgi:hypothetical protein